jgi:hypothetical protein
MVGMMVGVPLFTAAASAFYASTGDDPALGCGSN